MLNPPASVSRVLGLQVYVSMPGSHRLTRAEIEQPQDAS